MYNNYYYPAGADTPDAPWNQPDPEEKNFNVSVSCSLSKDTDVTTDDWSGDEDYEYIEHPQQAYEENWFTPEKLIDFASQAASLMLSEKDYRLADKYTLMEIVASAKDWTVDEFNVEQS